MEQGKKVVIIGSGIGGLVCGAILAQEGYQVTILEMNRQIGGNLQTFVRDRHIFDSGVHYVGGLDKGQNLYKIFRYLNIIDLLKMEKLNISAFDKISFESDGKEYAMAQGYDNFISSLVKDFPDEEPAIRKYCDAMRTVCSRFPLYNLREGDYLEKSEFLTIDLKHFIDSLTENQRLRNVLAGNNLLYAGVPDKTPFYVHALVLNSYIESSYRFINGGSQIAKYLTRSILRHGGSIINRTEVTNLHVEHGNVVYAQTSKGDRFHGDYFISNIHPAKTLKITDTEAIRPAYRHRIESLENSISFFMVNITLKPGMFPYEQTNHYCFLDDDVWSSMIYDEDTWPRSYALFYSGKGNSHPYAEGITVMTYMHYNEVAEWADVHNTVGRPGVRGLAYEAFKKRKAEKLISAAETKFPGLRNAIRNYYASTPLTFRDYMGTDDGSIYGIVKDYKDPLKTFISPRMTKISNLLLTGQNINLHGILGVSISAVVTCSVLLGMTNLIRKIDEAQHA